MTISNKATALVTSSKTVAIFFSVPACPTKVSDGVAGFFGLENKPLYDDLVSSV